jgi:hypothetical protein
MTGTPDYTEMANDAQTINNLVLNPNATAQDLITASQIALKYQNYMNNNWGAVGTLQSYLTQLQTDQANGTYKYSNYVNLSYLHGDLGSLLTTDISAGLAAMAVSQNWTPGEVFIDPDYATGYEYASNINFKSVLIPQALPGGQSTFELVVGDKTFTLEAGKRFWFAKDGGFPDGVPTFTIRGINLVEHLDPTNMNAFVTGLTWMEGNGANQTTMRPIVKTEPAGLPAAWRVGLIGTCVLLLGTCVVSGWFLLRRRSTVPMAA